MKSQDLLAAGIKPSTIAGAEYDIGELVSTEEFDRKTDPLVKNPQTDFEQRVLRRLLFMRVPFSTPMSIGFTAVKSLVRITCPYAADHMKSAAYIATGIDHGDQMVASGGGGTRESMRYEFRCPTCKATVSLKMPTNHGITVTPPK